MEKVLTAVFSVFLVSSVFSSTLFESMRFADPYGPSGSVSEQIYSNPKMNPPEARKLLPDLVGLDDDEAVERLRNAHFQEMTLDAVAKRFNVLLFRPKKLGFIDKWRYEYCIQDAAHAPTERGVTVGAKACQQRFEQIK